MVSVVVQTWRSSIFFNFAITGFLPETLQAVYANCAWTLECEY